MTVSVAGRLALLGLRDHDVCGCAAGHHHEHAHRGGHAHRSAGSGGIGHWRAGFVPHGRHCVRGLFGCVTLHS